MALSSPWTSLCTQGKEKGQDGRLKSVSQVVKAEMWKKSGCCGQGSKCYYVLSGHRWKPITCWIKAGEKKSFILKMGRREGDPTPLGIPHYLGQGKNPEKALPPKPRAPQSFPQTEAKPRNTNNLERFRKLIISPWCHWVINSREFINLHFLTHCPNTIITIYKN